VAFARVLRGMGLAVPVDAVIAYGRALAAVGLEQRAWVYWAGRGTLVREPEDVPCYDRAFASFWLQPLSPLGAVRTPPAPPVAGDDGSGASDTGDPEDDQVPTVVARYSPEEVLRQKDFALCSPAELDDACRMMRALRVEAVRRRSRRWRRSNRRRGRPDARRTLRQAVRKGGEVVRRHHLQPGTRARRVVLLCDVSGSMDAYARALLRFLHVAVAGRGQVEAFALGTRLTRLTRHLSSRDPDAALAAAAAAVPDWSGGTRLGESLRAFNDRFGVRGMARGAVVIVLSDGWDRGSTELLAAEMARLGRVAHRVVWVNPLKGSPGYEPLARGMAAALPFVDRFLEGHSVASLDGLAEVIADETTLGGAGESRRWAGRRPAVVPTGGRRAPVGTGRVSG
jgi:uncharacterized protein